MRSTDLTDSQKRELLRTLESQLGYDKYQELLAQAGWSEDRLVDIVLLALKNDSLSSRPVEYPGDNSYMGSSSSSPTHWIPAFLGWCISNGWLLWILCTLLGKYGLIPLGFLILLALIGLCIEDARKDVLPLLGQIVLFILIIIGIGIAIWALIWLFQGTTGWFKWFVGHWR